MTFAFLRDLKILLWLQEFSSVLMVYVYIYIYLHVYTYVFIYIYNCLVFIIYMSLDLSGKQRKIARYYRKQEELLKEFSELESFSELGCLSGAPSEV